MTIPKTPSKEAPREKKEMQSAGYERDVERVEAHLRAILKRAKKPDSQSTDSTAG